MTFHSPKVSGFIYMSNVFVIESHRLGIRLDQACLFISLDEKIKYYNKKPSMQVSVMIFNCVWVSYLYLFQKGWKNWPC